MLFFPFQLKYKYEKPVYATIVLLFLTSLVFLLDVRKELVALLQVSLFHDEAEKRLS